MAPFNLENNIREKLENRELTPSPGSWKKLEAQLGENQHKKKSVGWYYIAASVAGLLIAVSVFLNGNDIQVENTVVVEKVDQKNNNQTETELVSNLPKSVIEDYPSEKSKAENEPKQTTKNLKPLPPQKQSTVDKKIKRSEALADLSKDENPVESKSLPLTPIKEEDDFFNAKVDEVVASVKSLNAINEEITLTEVDALLKNARRDIQTQRILKSSKVDASALLQDVE